MAEPDFREVFAKARKLRAGGFSALELNQWIEGQTNGQVPDIATLASVVGGQSERVTVAEAPSKIPGALRGVAAGVQQFGQGASLGFADELAGLVFGDEVRDDARNQLENFEKEHPLLAPGLQALGGLATGVATAGILPPGAGVAGQAAVAGIEGGLAGAGSAEGSLAERAIPAAIGAATGLGTAGLLGAAGNVVSRTASRLRPGTAASRNAVEVGQEFIDRIDDVDADQLLKGLPGLRRVRSAAGNETRLADLAPFEGVDDAIDDILNKATSIEEVANDILESRIPAAVQSAMIATVQKALAAARFAGGAVTRAGRLAQKKAVREALKDIQRQLRSVVPEVQDDFVRALARPGLPGALSPLAQAGAVGAGVAAGGGSGDPAGRIFNPIAEIAGALGPPQIGDPRRTGTAGR